MSAVWHGSVGWPWFGGFLLGAVGMLGIGEYVVAVALLVLSGVSILSKLHHWRGPTGLKWVGALIVIVVGILALVSTWALKDDKPWSNVAVAWSKYTAESPLPDTAKYHIPAPTVWTATTPPTVMPPYLTKKQTKDAAGHSLPRTEPRISDGSEGYRDLPSATLAQFATDLGKKLVSRTEEFWLRWKSKGSNNDAVGQRAEHWWLGSEVMRMLPDVERIHDELLRRLGPAKKDDRYEQELRIMLMEMHGLPTPQREDSVIPENVTDIGNYLQVLAQDLSEQQAR